MPTLQAGDIGDLVVGTQKELGELKITDLSTDLQKHVAMSTLLKKNRVEIDAGTSIQWQLLVDHSNAAQFVGLFATDNVNVADGMIQAEMPWRHCNTNYAVDEHEIAMNRSPRKVMDIVKVRRHMAMVSLAAKMEDKFWSYPTVSDTVNPHGVYHWIVKNNTTGFNGTVPSGYTTVAGVNPTTYPRWANFTGQYTNVTKDDFMRLARQMATKTAWTPPVSPGLPSYSTSDMYGYFGNYALVGRLEELCESQNENLGNDLASKDGQVLFRRVPVTYVPKLDADTTDPLYAIPWGDFKTYILRGWWLKEKSMLQASGQHNVVQTFVDSSFNWIMKNRRTAGVIAKDVTLP